MDTVKVRELPQKSGSISLTDLIIVEDNDGTKIAEVGEFRSLLQQSIYFNTVDDMKNATLHEGDVVRTLGYRDVNDGGGATYKIVYAPTDLDDGMLIHYLHTSDTLRAHLIHDGSLNVLQCGAFGDGVSDDYTFITKALEKGYPLFFPKKTYRLSGPLELPSNTNIDFNGSTLFCSVSSCICLGLNEDMNSIVIKNAIFKGKYGIEIYPYAKDIVISNCSFIAMDSARMEKAISINGASNIQISNCTIGFKNKEVGYGLYLSSGLKSTVSYGNSNISITGNKIVASQKGIELNSTTDDKNIVITDNMIEGYGSDVANTGSTVGIQISDNCESMIIASNGLSNLYTGVVVTGIVDVTVGFTDMIFDDTRIMYSILSDQAKVTISGLQKFCGMHTKTTKATDPASNICYIFDRMTGILKMNTIIDTSVVPSGVTIRQCLTSLAGDLVDSIHPTCRDVITLSSASELNNNLNNKIPGYMNVAIDLNYSGNINDLTFPSLNGQLVAVYSSSGATLKSNTNILMSADVKLNRYTPVILRNNNGLWTRVA